MNSPLRQLLVHVDGTGSAAPRLQAARHIAGSFGASLAALYAALPAYVGMPALPELPAGVANGLAEVDHERLARARATFDKAMTGPGPMASWGESRDLPVVGAFVEQALYADLLVLGQRYDADPQADTLPADFVESVVMGSGKPALVIPYVGWSGAIGSNVAIAWKPTREAARAVSAALPLLQRARHVHVLAWGAEEPPDVRGVHLDLAGWLRRHEVDAVWHRTPHEPEPLGDLLLTRAFDLEADLLVMGCYGHARLREWVLGGTSRTVLGSMTLPVLLAH